MRKIFAVFLVLIFCFSIFNTAKADITWSLLGDRGFSPGGVGGSGNFMVLDSTNHPYTFFSDRVNGWKATVMKWDGESWVVVGTAGFSDADISAGGMAIDSTDHPYVTYVDYANGSKATVMKYNGSAWVVVGTAGFSDGTIGYPSIKLDSNDIPYVSYEDYANGSKATVMKYNGSAWVVVGTAGFSDGAVYDPNINIDSTDVPYVSFEDTAHGHKATVMKYNGSAWVNVGDVGFTTDEVMLVRLEFDSSDTPFIAFNARTSSYKPNVMKYNGSTWEYIGDPNFTSDAAWSLSLTLNSNDTPYVSFQDVSNNNKVSVMAFNGSEWDYIGTPAFSSVSVYGTTIKIDSNDIPYVFYVDNSADHKATVEYLTDLSVYESDETLGTPSPDSPGTLSTYLNYFKTFATDASYWITNLSGSNSGYDSQVYKINKDISHNSNPKYTISWTGHGDIPEDKSVSISIWNFLTSSWEQLTSSHCSEDCTLSGTKTGKKYHDNDGNVWVWAKAENAMPSIEIIDGSLMFDSSARTLVWSTNVAGDTEAVFDTEPHDTWQEFLDSTSGNMVHTTDAGLVTSHSISSVFATSNLYFMARSTSEDDGVVTSDLQGPRYSSCPFIFTYNGASYDFITDASSSATLGIGLDRVTWANTPWYKDPNANNNYPNPLSYAKIPHGALVPRTEDGETYYDIKNTTELNEVNYFDASSLLVIDHDPSVDVYPDYRDSGAIHTISKSAPAPVSVVDQDGHDMLSLVASNDATYYQSPTSATPTYLDIKLSNDATTPANLKLLIERGKEGPFSGGTGADKLQYKTADGTFVDVPSIYNPFVVTRPGASKASRARFNSYGLETKIIDLSGLDIKDNTIRLVTTNTKRQWDIDWLAVDTSPDATVTTSTLAPYSADLHYRGISQKVKTNPLDPAMILTQPIYETLTSLFSSNNLSGNATKYGEVAPLLESVDDEYVVMVQGDELGLKYHVPDQAPDTERDFVYSTFDYHKAYIYATGDTIDPLPFEAMTQYPYHTETEDYPYADHQAYLDEWNTRVIDWSGSRADIDPNTLHHSLNTDFLNIEVSKGSTGSTGGSSAGAIASFFQNQNTPIVTPAVTPSGPVPPVPTVNTSTSKIQQITKDLVFGIKGSDDVYTLQLFLISQAKGPSAKALATHGATHNFGQLTKNALKEWQASNGIVPSTGNFGPKTRAKIKELGL